MTKLTRAQRDELESILAGTEDEMREEISNLIDERDFNYRRIERLREQLAAANGRLVKCPTQ